jgi:hypothetical protein
MAEGTEIVGGEKALGGAPARCCACAPAEIKIAKLTALKTLITPPLHPQRTTLTDSGGDYFLSGAGVVTAGLDAAGAGGRGAALLVAGAFDGGADGVTGAALS